MKQAIRPSVLIHAILGAAVLFFVGWADHLSGFQLNLSVLYYIPIALWAWYIGLGPALLMALVCTAGCWLNDALTDHHYANEAYRYVNAVIQLFIFGAVAICIHVLHKRFYQEKELGNRLSHAVFDLEKSMAEVDLLRNQSLMICPKTRRIKIDGEWTSLELFLGEKLGLHLYEEISDEALSEMVNRMMEYHGSRE